MTYIEFFSSSPIENICTTLTDTPGAVVLVGCDLGLMERHRENYLRFFNGRGVSVDIICRTVKKYNFADAVNVLTDIVNTYPDCVFDITGGDEVTTMALGVVYERCAHNIKFHKFNLRNGDIFDCDMDGKTIYRFVPQINIHENMIIHGGDIKFGEGDNRTDFWDMSEEFVEDIDKIWQICKGNQEDWNNYITMLNTVESAGDTDGIFSTAARYEVDRRLHALKDYTHEKQLITRALIDAGLILAFEYNTREIVVGYKSAQVKKCLLRAGLALELKVFSTLQKLKNADGSPMYNDVMNGVVIDWDSGAESAQVDTENEIDIMAMHGIVPIFISCKNGNFNVDELFKLSTIAERFGGKYAKKVLIAAKLPDGIAGEHLRRRMADMKIHLIEGLHNCSDKKVEEKLAKLWIK